MKADSRVRFLYLRDHKRTPMGCVAYRVISGRAIEYGLSFRNPLDHFDRKVARELAAGRLALRPTVFELSREESLRTTISYFQAFLEEESSVPNRIKRELRKAHRLYTMRPVTMVSSSGNVRENHVHIGI